MKDKLTFEQECSLIANGEDLPKKKVYLNKTYKVKILNKSTHTLDCTFVDGHDWEEVAKKVNDLLKDNEFIKSVEFVMEGRRV